MASNPDKFKWLYVVTFLGKPVACYSSALLCVVFMRTHKEYASSPYSRVLRFRRCISIVPTDLINEDITPIIRKAL